MSFFRGPNLSSNSFGRKPFSGTPGGDNKNKREEQQSGIDPRRPGEGEWVVGTAHDPHGFLKESPANGSDFWHPTRPVEPDNHRQYKFHGDQRNNG